MLEQDRELKKIEEFKEKSLRKYIYSSNNINAYKACPHCGCKDFIKFGKYQGIQRYKCKNKACKKSFSNSTNSVWKYIKHEPEKWIKFIELMIENETLEACSYKLEISISTAFYWRHKLLHAIDNNFSPQVFKDAVNIRYYSEQRCYKGSRNKHYTYEEKLQNKIDKMYENVPRDVSILVAKGINEETLISVEVPCKRVDDNVKNNLLKIIDKNCFIHIERFHKGLSVKCVCEHNRKLPIKIRRKYDFKIDKYNVDMKDNINYERVCNWTSKISNWIWHFKGIATKYITHYYKFFALINSEKYFDYIHLFLDILRNGMYTSIQMLKDIHLENY